MSKYPSGPVSPVLKDSRSVLLHLMQWQPHSTLIRNGGVWAGPECMYICGAHPFTPLKKERDIPLEIDDHFKLFGKEPWEVDYGEKCPVCDVRIDEYGFCSCGSSGE